MWKHFWVSYALGLINKSSSAVAAVRPLLLNFHVSENEQGESQARNLA